MLRCLPIYRCKNDLMLWCPALTGQHAGSVAPRITWDEQGLVLYRGTDLPDAEGCGLLLPKVSEARKARIERLSLGDFPKMRITRMSFTFRRQSA
jgi:hypothetical protein